MPSTIETYMPYQLAQEVHKAMDDVGSNGPLLLERLQAPIVRFLATDVSKIGVKRIGNHIEESKYVYYDGDMHMTVDHMPKGQVIPAHDHGVWECMAVFGGQLHHTVYERKDDESIEDYAELELYDDRVLERFDVAMVAAPSEIHSFVALTDDTMTLTIVGGHYKPLRHYFDVDGNSYRTMAPGQIKPRSRT